MTCLTEIPLCIPSPAPLDMEIIPIHTLLSIRHTWLSMVKAVVAMTLFTKKLDHYHLALRLLRMLNPPVVPAIWMALRKDLTKLFPSSVWLACSSD